MLIQYTQTDLSLGCAW